MLVVDKDAIDRLNRSTRRSRSRRLPAFKPVVAGEMIATVKIIPFAVAARPRATRRWRWRTRHAAGPGRALSHPQGRRGLDRAAGARRQGDREDLRVTDERLAPAGASDRRRAPRAARAAARWRRRSRRCCAEGAELVVVFGASAIADRRDVIPAAVEAIGGRIEHFGMPVDPGNLLLIGRCARPAGARRAGLRALAEGERLRLGSDAAARRPCRCRARTSPASASAAC